VRDRHRVDKFSLACAATSGESFCHFARLVEQMTKARQHNL
jgi:hypothetical protein